ncbi:MAG: hypothetical protein ABFS09_06465 [Thermodesulfobacteriota bacterium]
MRQFVIDELSAQERDNLDSYLKKSLKSGPMLGMFWLQLPEDLWSKAQKGHDECGPFYFGVELSKDKLIVELLVRSESNLHCSCISYATPSQREYVLGFVDTMIGEEHITA